MPPYLLAAGAETDGEAEGLAGAVAAGAEAVGLAGAAAVVVAAAGVVALGAAEEGAVEVEGLPPQAVMSKLASIRVPTSR